MHRVEVTADHSDLLAIAFTGEQGNTLVLVNRADKPVLCIIPAGGKKYRYMERTSQYFQNQVKAPPAPENEQLKIRIEPGEIITLTNVELNGL